MKAILVIDKPKNCYECSLCAEEVIYGKTEFVCKGYGSIIESLDGNDWCPLRPLPEKSTYEIADDHPFTKAEIMAYTYGLTVGRNQVIEEITNESSISN